MTRQVVKVLDVTFDVPVKGQKGEYKATVFNFKVNGAVKEIKIASNFLDKNIKLKNQLKSLQSGETVTLDTILNGNFTNIQSIYKDGESLPEEIAEESAAPKVPASYISRAASTSSNKFEKQPTHPTDALRMARSVALREAVAMAAIGKFQPETSQIIECAKEFEAYITND